MKPRAQTERAPVQAVGRALDVLLVVAQAGPISLTGISERVGLHKSTVHRLLTALSYKRFVARASGSDLYEIGDAAAQISYGRWTRPDVRRAARRHMEWLQQEIGETTLLDVRAGGSRVCVEQVECGHDIRRSQKLGVPLPLHAGAMGRVLLAGMELAQVRQLIRDVPLTSFTPWTPGTLDELERRVEDARRAGFAVSQGERVPEAISVAAPIRDASGAVVAAMGVSGPAFRFTAEEAERAVPRVIRAAELTSRELGWAGTALAEPSEEGHVKTKPTAEDLSSHEV